MTNVELNKALYDKCDKEFDEFIDEVNQAYQDKTNGRLPLEHGDEFLTEYAYQYSIYGDILMALEDANLSDDQYKALIDNPYPLFSIYEEWLDNVTWHTNSIRDCIGLCADREIAARNREKDCQADHIFDNLEFKLGLYNQFIPAYAADAEEGRASGIALQAYQDGEPYGVATVNVPSLTGVCEFIGIKNAAYMDTNNFPWVTKFLDKGIAKDTGFTRRSGFCEYPLYQFDESWLKSLKPIVSDRTYDMYEKKYNQAMGIDEVTKEAVRDSEPELTIRSLTEQERDYTYTQERRILEDSGCVGHLRVDMDTAGTSFYTDWTDHVHELNDSAFKNEFDHIINELRNNPEYGNILTTRDDMKKYCEAFRGEAAFGGEPPVYGFRVDSDNWACLMRLDPTPGNYAAYIYAYDKDSLDEHLEDIRNREKITVLKIEPGKEPKSVEIYNDLHSLQNEVGGFIEGIFPWGDSVGIIVNEEGKLMGLPLNRALRDNDGNIYDAVAGTMLIVGLTEDNFCSLTSAQLEHYMELFKEPETIRYACD